VKNAREYLGASILQFHPAIIPLQASHHPSRLKPGGLEFGHIGKADPSERAYHWINQRRFDRALAERVNPERIAIIQPRVARHELPWVAVDDMESTLQGLNQGTTYV